MRTSWAAVFVWSVWAVLFVALLGYVAAFGRNVPFGDDWMVLPGVSGEQPADASWLWRHHNEHRIPLPKLIWVVLGRLTHSDMRAGIYLISLLLGGISAALIVGVRRLRGSYSPADAFFPLALLHWGQHQTINWSFEVQFAVSTVLSLTALLTLVSVRRTPTAGQGATVGVCLLALPLCGLNGALMVPPLALWLAAAAVVRWRSGLPGGRRDGAVWLGLAVAAAAVVVLILAGGSPPGVHVPRPTATQVAQTACQFFVMALGPGGDKGLPFTALALLLLVAVCVLSLVVGLRKRPDERWRASGLLCYLAAMLGLGLAIGWGRGEAGVTAEHGTRFATIAVPLLCWCYLALQLDLGSPRLRRGASWLLFLAVLALLPFNIYEGYRYGVGQSAILSAVAADIRAGVPPAEVAERWAGRLGYDVRDDIAQRLEWLRQTRQGPYRE